MNWVDIIHDPAQIDHSRVHDQLGDYCRESPEPDGEGIFESIGHGFVYLQRYMIQRKRTTRNPCSSGPRVGAYHFAEVINAAANYWKHVDEWPWAIDLHSRSSGETQALVQQFLNPDVARNTYRKKSAAFIQGLWGLVRNSEGPAAVRQ